jgi:alpha-mannosidase
MMDLGLNRYSFAIFSHEGKAGAETQLQARLFTQPMCAVVCDNHKGSLGTEYSFGGVSTNDIIIRAMKKAEESDEIIVRLGEGTKNNVDGFTLTLGDGIESAREVYASEEYLGEARVVDGKLVADFKPYEIKSFALTLKNSSLTAEKVISTSVKLNPDKQLVSKQNTLGDFKYTIPYEITPDSITIGGVDFEIKKDGKNAIVCNGQKITINKRSKLVLLCNSIDGDKNAKFKVGKEAVEKFIPDAFQRPARWDMYDF